MAECSNDTIQWMQSLQQLTKLSITDTYMQDRHAVYAHLPTELVESIAYMKVRPCTVPYWR